MNALSLRTGSPQRYSPKDFFTGALAALFKSGKRAIGSVGFVLSGKDGGSWSVDLAAGSVQQGRAQGSLVMALSAADFTDLLHGKLNVRAAMTDGRFTYRGDAAVFTSLAQFLTA